MIDFNALMGVSKRTDTINPISIIEELPKKGTVHDLYKVQAEILEAWFKDREKHQDTVIELNTGGGKTLVGLLIALSTARETKMGTLYLVENKQLVSQVIDQAALIGIPAKPYDGRKSLDADFDNGNVVLVGAYQTLFNGKSVFGVKGSRSRTVQLGGIVIDDAHASLTAIREAFTFIVPANEESVVYKRILAELADAFTALGRSHAYEELREGVGSHIVEIPYEYWRAAENRVFSILLDEEKGRSNSDDNFSQSLKFNWPLIKDNLRYCQVVVSRERVSIAAMYPLLQMIPSFRSAKRRIYMSATITDYGDMVRAYDLRRLEASAIIAPKTVSGVGRRMILFPSPEQLGSEELRALIEKELDNRHGIVKLSSNPDSELVERFSCYEPMGNEKVIEAVESLRQGLFSKPVSFVNRYNGIDLPDDACRVLILEGLPASGNDIDTIMMGYLPESDITAQRIAQKIEQGMGRGVRGASDHCVVLVVGYSLVEWMKRKNNRRFFSPPLQTQIGIGEEIGRQVHSPADLCDAMRQELDSADLWVDYHALKLARDMPDSQDPLGGTFAGACVERRAFSLWQEGDPTGAIETILSKLELFSGDPSYQGWLLSIASRIAFDSGSRSEAEEYARRAHSLNYELDVARAAEVSDAPDWALSQARGVLDKLRLLKGDSIQTQFDRDMAGLDFGVAASEFESSLESLGSYLGFESRRKDQKGDGPDVYWVEPLCQVGWAIEAKSEKKPDSSFHKSEAGQLRTACDWLRQKHPGINAVGVSVHPNDIADHNASAANLNALTPGPLDSLKRNVRLFLGDIGSFADREKESEIAWIIVDRRMGLEDLAADYLVPFKSSVDENGDK